MKLEGAKKGHAPKQISFGAQTCRFHRTDYNHPVLHDCFNVIITHSSETGCFAAADDGNFYTESF